MPWAISSTAAGYGTDRIRIDPSVVRGLEYYTGPVFEIELTFPVTNEKGEQVVFGSVGGGGRYDGLVSRFRAEPVPATGFSIGVSRLANALKTHRQSRDRQNAGPVVVLVLDRDADAIADYQKMTSELRQAGIRAEMYLGSSGMNAQMKYADRRNAAAAVIVGSNERAEGKVTIKDLAAGAEQAKAIKDNAEYKAAKVGQVVVRARRPRRRTQQDPGRRPDDGRARLMASRRPVNVARAMVRLVEMQDRAARRAALAAAGRPLPRSRR